MNVGGLRPGGVGGGELANRLGGFRPSGLSPGGFRPGGFAGAGGRLPNFAGGAGVRPTRSGLNQFLGLPSDAGLHHLSGQTQSRLSQFVDNQRAGDRRLNNFIPGETQSRLSQLADKARQGDGSIKNRLPGEEQSRLSKLYDQYRTGNHPLRPVSPWRWHNNAVIVRNNFNNYYFFTPDWYRRYPGAWYPASWAYGDAWTYANWAAIATWLDFRAAQPIFYDYGTNILDQNGTVYVNGQAEGSPAEYYAQAQTLAETDGTQQGPKEEQWMPLGVFALSNGTQSKATMIMQLAVNKQGILRGNYTNTATDKTTPIRGAVNKTTERAAWTIGDDKDTVIETGLYNLTKNQAPVLIHSGKDQTEQMVLVRLDQKNQQESASP